MTINCHGYLLDLATPRIMGILNLTPDSFYDGGQYADMDEILRHTEQMVNEGVYIIDIGGMSSRPGSGIISADEELQRVMKPIEAIVKKFPKTLLSIDTLHARVASEAVAAGVAVVNDISAGEHDPDMIPTVARLGVPYIIMHKQGDPATMQLNPHYEQVGLEVLQYLQGRVAVCRAAGIHDVVVDPGFGFGKTVEHNYTLLKELSLLKMLNCPILVGLSRKSMVTRVLDVKAVDALNGTTVLHTLALLNGANILRVHDVCAAKEVVKLMGYYYGQN